jgi:hypothetical protein
MRGIIIFYLCLILIGCSTFGDIHKSEPIKVIFVVDKSPETLANCTLFEAKSKGLNATLTQKEDKYLLLLSRTYINDIPFGEVSFRPQEKGTFIEIRASNGYGVKDSWALDCVMPCASSQNSPGK